MTDNYNINTPINEYLIKSGNTRNEYENREALSWLKNETCYNCEPENNEHASRNHWFSNKRKPHLTGKPNCDTIIGCSITINNTIHEEIHE